MKKMRRLSLTLLSIALMLVGTINVNAASQNEKQSKPYYTNLNGVKMTKTQYVNLSRDSMKIQLLH